MKEPKSMSLEEYRRLTKGTSSYRDVNFDVGFDVSCGSLGDFQVNPKMIINARMKKASSVFYREQAQAHSIKRNRRVGGEELFQQDFNALAKSCGALHYHTHNSKYSAPGFPDNVTILPSGKLIISELKVKPGKASKHQTKWLEGWQQWRELAGIKLESASVHLWFPEDWQEILEVFEIEEY